MHYTASMTYLGQVFEHQIQLISEIFVRVYIHTTSATILDIGFSSSLIRITIAAPKLPHWLGPIKIIVHLPVNSTV